MRSIVHLLPFALAACANTTDDPSRAGTTRSFPIAGFTTVDLRGPDDVDVRVGAGFSVRAQGDQETLGKLRIERDGDTLTVGRAGRFGFTWGKSGRARIFVTMPRIARAGISGSGNLSVDHAEGAAFTGGIGGSGNLRVAAMAVDQARLSISGSGNVTAAGTARTLEMSLTGSGDIDARRVAASQGDVSLAGSGTIAAAIAGPATVSLAGSGDIDLGPAARCRTRNAGSGRVRCGK